VAWKTLTEAARFAEALALLRKRVPMTDAEFKATLEKNHQAAFTIAHVAQLDVVTQLWESLQKATDDGVDFATWKKEIGPKLRNAWGKPNSRQTSARMATVYRNAVQTSFNHGRWEQMNHPDVVELRPFRQFEAISDSRTTSVCREANGTILPADDAWWDSHVPPLHHQCRSHVRSLRKSVATKKGITETPPAAKPKDGFGAKPKPRTPPTPDPDLGQYPEPLAAIYRAKVAAAA
jgi:SPP1 gp7 family putative phage head morphogenesis protein